MRVGVAQRDITPDHAYLSGFVARQEPAQGVLDPITVRALVVDETAIVTLDVCGVDEATCAAIREHASLSSTQVVVQAIHTHAGPASMPERLERRVDLAWLGRLVGAAVEALAEAQQNATPARLLTGLARDPGVGKNRRRLDGPTDPLMPILAFETKTGRLATVVSHACHPVVLGPDNLLFSADYPSTARRMIEAAHPGSVCLWLTGCAGDVNTGHAATDSFSRQAAADRTPAEAQRVGQVLAKTVLSTSLKPSASTTTSYTQTPIQLDFVRPSTADLNAQIQRFDPLAAKSPAEEALMQNWRAWALDHLANPGPSDWSGTVSLLTWGDANLVALPGEPFSVLASAVRAILGNSGSVVFGYANGCPGYIPTSDEYPFGGYEVADAYRYYNMPGPFAPDSAERLLDAISRLHQATPVSAR